MGFAAVNLPEFPIVAWRRTALSHARPLVVVEGIAPQEKVVALCERARAAGIAHGMSKVQAEAGGAALFRARSLEEERAAFDLLLETVDSFSPRIEAIGAPANAYGSKQPLDVVLLLDSAGMGTLFGTAGRYARQLHTALATAGFPAGVGAAPNAEAAIMLARSTSRIACADRATLQAKLAPLSVALLPCEGKMLRVLSRWGIRTLGELAALPDTALVSRLGQPGRRLQQLARGDADHLLVAAEPPFVLSESTTLDTSVTLLDALLFAVSPLLETIMRQAIERAYALRMVRLTLQLERGGGHTIEVRPVTPTQNRAALLKLLHLELQAHQPPAGIVAITLEADPAPPQTAQRGLFQAQFPTPDKLDLLLARLRALAGDHGVGSPELKNSHREDAFSMGRFQPSEGNGEKVKEAMPRLAIRLLRPPQPMRVTLQGRQPHMLSWQGTRFGVHACAGPWHSSGSWWDGQAWDDELWDVVTTAPRQAVRLRQNHATKTWFVVGLYD